MGPQVTAAILIFILIMKPGFSSFDRTMNRHELLLCNVLILKCLYPFLTRCHIMSLNVFWVHTSILNSYISTMFD